MLESDSILLWFKRTDVQNSLIIRVSLSNYCDAQTPTVSILRCIAIFKSCLTLSQLMGKLAKGYKLTSNNQTTLAQKNLNV